MSLDDLIGNDEDGSFFNRADAFFDCQHLLRTAEFYRIRLDSQRAKLNEIGTEYRANRIRFFDNLAVGAGAALVAIVSFAGSHYQSLHPLRLLNALLVTLAVLLLFSLARNYLQPLALHHGVAATVDGTELLYKSMLNSAEQLKSDFPTYALPQAFQRKQQLAEQFALDREKIQTNFDLNRRKAAYTWKLTRWSERISLASLVVATILAIVLFNLNFR